MPRGSVLTDNEKDQIDDYKKNGLSYRQIAAKIKRSSTVIANYVKNPSAYNTIKRPGRKPILNERDKRAICKKASNSSVSSSQIISQLRLNVSRWTINRAINNSGARLNRKPTEPAVDKVKRLEWARNHMTWNKEWEKVVWSGEKKFNLDGPHRDDDSKSERLSSRLRRNLASGCVTIWAAFGHNGKSDIVLVDKRSNANHYRSLLETHMDNIRHKILSDGVIFQLDDAIIDRANVAKQWFKDKNIDLLELPPLSRDLNPIENLWAILVGRIYPNDKQYATVIDLQKAIVDEWEKISLKELRNQTTSMTNRIFELIRNQGGKISH